MNVPVLHSGGRVAAIVPQTFEDCFRIARAVCAARMAPKGMDSPEACTVAIMHGLEIGLTPMAALQRIAVVNGRPTVWGDGAIGLVRASGLCAYIKERIEGDGDDRVALCETKRRDEEEAIVGRFSIADAKRAGLWGKSGPWTQYPDRMLKMRARAFALRDGFADVLGGLYLREEIEEDKPREMRDVTPQPAAAAIEAPAEQRTETAGPVETVSVLDDFEAWFDAAVTVEDLDRISTDHRTDYDALNEAGQRRVRQIKARHAKRIAEAASAPAATTEAGEDPAIALAKAYDSDPEAYLKRVDEAFAAAADIDALSQVYDGLVEIIITAIFPPDLTVCRELFDKHQKRIETAA